GHGRPRPARPRSRGNDAQRGGWTHRSGRSAGVPEQQGMTSALLPDDVVALARRVVEQNMAIGRKVVVAESCTGGLVAAALTEIPGSSGVLDRGFVTYSNESKQQSLGVPGDIIDAFGAVSIACVYAMARGALERSEADVAVA